MDEDAVRSALSLAATVSAYLALRAYGAAVRLLRRQRGLWRRVAALEARVADLEALAAAAEAGEASE